jgi:hypothetical protein
LVAYLAENCTDAEESPVVQSYRELVAGAAPTTQRHEVYLAGAAPRLVVAAGHPSRGWR